ncbi:hypothetical protein [Lewinella sp. IMCC34183]|uniref:hypothetical protein n=1 Tax=Lewinella sp. IMCC34183 TaxID=2248762 RepID=UPI000E2581BF|nr:hypothetical protein [Lewinella sp. IMCC34183]
MIQRSFPIIFLCLLALTGCREDPAWGEVRIYFQPTESDAFEVISMDVRSIHKGQAGDAGVRNGDAFQSLPDQRNQSGFLDEKLDLADGPAYLTTSLPPQRVDYIRTEIFTAELRNLDD